MKPGENNPDPSVAPNPEPARPEFISCPSCDSSYNVETHELVKDTGLPEKLREAQTERDVWRTKAQELQAELDTLRAAPPAPAPEPPKKKRQDFLVA